ncbi:LysR family transcriptional regulator [Glutamicibacter sp. NPDC127525]|uniref:LysR family transcriptional regulator n=1 Tax=unclassified Glutamicibacter TaxID=2627139 RepID=UPI00362A1FDD
MAELTLRQFQYFVAVVDHGSVTAAAAACHISQAAASMAIAQLEKSLGADLLIRSRSRKLLPTAAGTEFARHARSVLERVAEAELAVSESVEQMRGALRVGCSPTLAPRLVPPLAQYFTQRHPLVDLRISEGAPGPIQDAVRQGKLDLAFGYAWQTDEDLRSEHVVDVHLQIMLPAGHRFAGRDSLRLAEIVEEPAVILDVPPTAERLTALVQSHGLELDIRWRSTSMENIRSLVGRGLGYSFANSVPATGTTYDGLEVVYVPVADAMEQNSVVAVLPAGHTMPRRVAAALELLREDTAQHG